MDMKVQENDMPLVSVIIPSYNVENFIEKCIMSILNLSYKKVEVLIIDDGSKDNTGIIADKYAAADERVRVIHKLNSGVSAARNTGIEESKGDYIIFVDADDYLSEDHVSYMLELVRKTGGEFCISKNCFYYRKQKQVEEKIEVLTPEEATSLLLSPQMEVGCWNKIYKRSLLGYNIRFSTDLFFGEGLNFITTVSQRANCVGVGTRRVYYYRRNNPDSATTVFDIRKYCNGEKALNAIKENLILKNKKINTMWDLHMCLFSMNAMIGILTDGSVKEYKKEYKHWQQYVRRNAVSLMIISDMSLKAKAKMLLMCVCPIIPAKWSSYKRKRSFEEST